MSNQIKITKDAIKACLFKEISDASQETDCPFTAEEIEYFFEHVFPTLDDDDGFYSHYDAAMQMSDKDFEVCFWDFGYANSNEILADISCINYDTKLFHIDDLDDCKELAKSFSDHEALQAVLTSNIQPNHKAEIFNILSEQHDSQRHGDYDTLKDNVITFEYRYREYITPEKFLQNYDGTIAKAILRRKIQRNAKATNTAKAHKI